MRTSRRVSRLAATSLTTALVCFSCCLVSRVQAFTANGVVRIGSHGAAPPAPYGFFESRRSVHTSAVAPTAVAADTQFELSTGSQVEASLTGHKETLVISKAAAVHDPFRPLRSSVDPIVINILVKAYSSNDDVERVCRKALRRRAKSPDLALEDWEKRLVFKRVLGVEVLRKRLTYLLEEAVRSSPLTSRRFGPTEADFGLPITATGDPMLIVNRAECLLALYMLTEEKVPVEFLDKDRLEVLSSLEVNNELFDRISDPAERLATKRSIPTWMAKRFIDQYGDSAADAISAWLNKPAPITLRVNTLKTTRDAVINELKQLGISAKPTRYSPWGVELESPPTTGIRVNELDLFVRGEVDVMNEASQCVTLSTGVKPYDISLIWGGKRGTKAVAMCNMLRGHGMIYVYEDYDRQLAQIAGSIKRLNADLFVEPLPGKNAAKRIKADVVLVDPICSNTGTLNHHPSMRWAKDEELVVETLVEQQKQWLSDAAQAVSPGGVLVYSTCSLLQCENEEVADWFEENYGYEFEPYTFDKDIPTGNRRLFLPHVHGLEGTFIARWRRRQL